MKIENLNAMPAPTWSWLKMNSTSLEIDPELAPAGAAAVEVEGAGACRGNDGDFEAALKLADSRFPARRAAARLSSATAMKTSARASPRRFAGPICRI